MKSFNYKVNSCPENNKAATKNIQEYKENFKKNNDLEEFYFEVFGTKVFQTGPK